MTKKGDTKDLKITPLGDRVLIQPLKNDGKEKKSASGIIISVSAEEDKADRGTVMAVGEGRIDNDGKLVPMKVKVGDKVMFQWGDKVNIDDEDYFMVSDSSILAILK